MTILENIIESLIPYVVPGQKTSYLAEVASFLLGKCGAQPAFLGYKPPHFTGEKGYPSVICVSINNEVIHGIPSERKIEEGDVVKIDIGLIKDGEYDDGATTVLVGKCSAAARHLVAATQEALELGIKEAKAGNTNLSISKAIEAVAKTQDLYVIHGYGGHGIGKNLHLEPHIPNEIDGTKEVTLESGMRLAIEPMFSTSSRNTYIASDGWTVKLHSGLSAHFEKTILVQ